MEADVYADGHDVVGASILWRTRGEPAWNDVPMRALGNDRWTGQFEIEELTDYEYTIEGWIDGFETWRQELSKKAAAGHEVGSELLEGSAALRAAGDRVPDRGLRNSLLEASDALAANGTDRVAIALSAELARQMSAAASRGEATRYDRILTVLVERERARLAPGTRCSPARREPIRHAARRSTKPPAACRRRLDGFRRSLSAADPSDRSQLPKGPNNSTDSRPGDPGSPWAIGSPEGGHMAIEPGLGTLDDFDRFVQAADSCISRWRWTSPSRRRPTIPM